MKRAFILEPTRVDVQPVERWGELVYLYGKNDRRPSIFSPEFVEEAVSRLEELGFDEESDAIVIAGSIAGVAQFVAGVTSQYGFVTGLAFNSTTREYAEVTLGIPPEQDEEVHDTHEDAVPGPV